MAWDYQRVVVTGTVVKVREMRSKKGLRVAKVQLLNRRGERKDIFHCTLTNKIHKLADVTMKYVCRGDRVLVEGVFHRTDARGKEFWNLNVDQLHLLPDSEAYPRRTIRENEQEEEDVPDEALPW